MLPSSGPRLLSPGLGVLTWQVLPGPHGLWQGLWLLLGPDTCLQHGDMVLGGQAAAGTDPEGQARGLQGCCSWYVTIAQRLSAQVPGINQHTSWRSGLGYAEL